MAAVTCPDCDRIFDDASRFTFCPHSRLEGGYCEEHDLYACPHHKPRDGLLQRFINWLSR